MDPTNSWIRSIAEQAWPLEQVWDYYSDEDVVRWIQYKLCQMYAMSDKSLQNVYFLSEKMADLPSVSNYFF